MDLKEKIERHLRGLCLGEGVLYEAARYSLLAPAKRIRPLLLLTGCMARNISIERGLVPACALELIHTYSLIHDDLPSMDDDALRRGQPTLHKVYGEALAILTGDYLLTYAFELVSTAPALTAEERVGCLAALAHAAGGEGMVGGQVRDILADPDITTMHRQKTAALFGAALRCVEILTPHAPPSLYPFGIAFGLLFQLLDDLADGDHPAGIEAATAQADHLYHHCLSLLDTFPNPAPLKTLFAYSFAKIA